MKTSNKLLLGLLAVVILAITVFIVLIGLTSASYANPVRSPEVPNHLVGKWEGAVRPGVIWVEAKSIPVTVAIKQNGEISGMLGDATIVNGTVIDRTKTFLGKVMDHRGYIVQVKLQGNIIDAEQIHRRSANIFFLDFKDGEWQNCSFHSSGTEIGGKKMMVLTSCKTVLRKAEDV
jgi:hypothetical protein